MCEGLDIVLEKSPVYDEGNVLYRFCTSDDKVDFKGGGKYSRHHIMLQQQKAIGEKILMYM